VPGTAIGPKRDAMETGLDRPNRGVANRVRRPIRGAFLRPGPYHVEVEDLSRGTRSEGRRLEVRRGATTDAGEFRL
jgi:hypothetical protein